MTIDQNRRLLSFRAYQSYHSTHSQRITDDSMQKRAFGLLHFGAGAGSCVLDDLCLRLPINSPVHLPFFSVFVHLNSIVRLPSQLEFHRTGGRRQVLK